MDRIPITVCHGIRPEGNRPLSAEHFDGLMRIAADMGFESINYDQLAQWRAGKGKLPGRPIMVDFDHAVRSIRDEAFDVLSRYGFRGNLFVHTGPLDQMYADGLPAEPEREWMTWDELAQLIDAGWHLGAHTVSHANLCKLLLLDPSGRRARAELSGCDATLKKRLKLTVHDFAFTGTTWSPEAEKLVAERYRFGRLWIARNTYEIDGKEVRYAEMVDISGPDEPDGGPPAAARYITRKTPPHRLPAMEIQGFIHSPAAFRKYLEGALG